MLGRGVLECVGVLLCVCARVCVSAGIGASERGGKSVWRVTEGRAAILIGCFGGVGGYGLGVVVHGATRGWEDARAV